MSEAGGAAARLMVDNEVLEAENHALHRALADSEGQAVEWKRKCVEAWEENKRLNAQTCDADLEAQVTSLKLGLKQIIESPTSEAHFLALSALVSASQSQT